MLEEDVKLVPAIYDFVFKAVLLNPKNRKFLLTLISNVTEIPMEEFQNVTIMNAEHTVNYKSEKRKRSDVIVKVGNQVINLEMNRKREKGTNERNYFYLSKVLTSMYQEKMEALDVPRMIQINFDNYSFFKKQQEVYHFKYHEKKSGIELDEYPEIYHVDLAYIYKICYNKDNKKLSMLERSALLLQAESKSEADKVIGEDSMLRDVYENIEFLSKDGEIIGLYDYEEEREAQEKRNLAYAKAKAIEKGLKKGMKQGMKNGIKQGIEQGIEQRTIELVKNLIKEDVDLKLIMKVTGLTEQEIREIL